MKKPTLKAIAKASGVSIATVSFALSGKGKISKDMSEKILQIASEMGYERQDRKYQRKQSEVRRITIMTYVNQEWAYAWNLVTPIINSIENSTALKDYEIILIPVQDPENIEGLFKNILDSQAEGIISIHYAEPLLFKRLEEMKIPALIVNNSKLLNEVCTVCSDDFEGAYNLTMFMIEKGHRRILYIDYYREHQESVLSDRFIGFKKAMMELCSEQEVVHITIGLFDVQVLKAELKTYLDAPEPPTAIFAHDDRLAQIIITQLETMGYRVPEDLSIVAPGDVLDYSCPITPRITTMSIQTTVLGHVAAEKMKSLIDDHHVDVHGLKVSQRLVDRGSCISVS
jgi:LacI family repressor for deo operon, udp, cdd, tsx, nupC, and nupG